METFTCQSQFLLVFGPADYCQLRTLFEKNEGAFAKKVFALVVTNNGFSCAKV